MKDPNKAQNYTIRIVLLALMASLILLTTLIYLPMGFGYYHIGDGFIFAAASLLGPYAAVSAAIGSALADLLAGFATYIPATAIIKGLMGLIAGFLIRHMYRHVSPKAPKVSPALLLRTVLVLLLCEAIMVGGYLTYETILYGFSGALGSVIPNCLQGLVGIVLGTVMVPLARRIPLRNK